MKASAKTRTRKRKGVRTTEARAVAIVAAGLVAANAVAGVVLAVALQSEVETAAQPAAFSAHREPVMADAKARVAMIFDSSQEAMAAGAMVFALSGFASVLVMRLARGERPSPSPLRPARSGEDEPRQP